MRLGQLYSESNLRFDSKHESLCLRSWIHFTVASFGKVKLQHRHLSDECAGVLHDGSSTALVENPNDHQWIAR